MSNIAEIIVSQNGTLSGATYAFAGINNVLDPYNLPIEKGQLVSASNLDIDNTNSISTRRGYSSIVAKSGIHSGWDNGNRSFYVDGEYLKEFVSSTDIRVIDIVTVGLRMYYTAVNDVILYSNGIEHGFIGGENKQSRTYSEYFKEDTVFGTHLEFYNGRVYHAKNNSLFCTDTFDAEHTDKRFSDVLTLRSKITMVRRVLDGLFVGSENQIHFLQGKDILEGGFDLKILADYGVINGSDVCSTGEYFPKSESTGEICLFMTQKGICTGGVNGKFINHSVGIYSPPAAKDSTAKFVKKNGVTQYICTLFTNTNIPENGYINNAGLLDN